MDFHKLLIRTLSGLVYCGIIIGAILSGRWGVAALATVFILLANLEFSKIAGNKDRAPSLTMIDILTGVCLALSPMEPTLAIGVIIAVMSRFILQLYAPVSSPVASISHSMLMFMWVAVPRLLMSCISVMWSPMIILALFLMLWINDTGAFLVGSTIGKHRLFERVSPKKSWEGFFGGLLFNVAFSVLFYYVGNEFFGMARLHAGLVAWILMAVIVTVFGTFGDLVESQLKRTLHLKDTGTMIPGHGGILDRIDSLLLALPAVFVYLFFVTIFNN